MAAWFEVSLNVRDGEPAHHRFPARVDAHVLAGHSPSRTLSDTPFERADWAHAGPGQSMTVCPRLAETDERSAA